MYEYKIKEIIKVIDGDTIDVLFDLGFNILFKERVRLANIDAPEVNSKNEQERLLGNQAKEYLSTWLMNQNILRIKTTKDDKYGRILGEIYGNDDVCVNKLLVEHGYAWIYEKDGKNLNILLERRNP